MKDVSCLLELVRSVGTGDFELHTEAQREMINLCFALDHVNYARYLSYQHIHLQKLQQDNIPAIDDLRRRGIVGSLSESNFSTIHGDLFTEVFNGQLNLEACWPTQVRLQYEYRCCE